MARKTQPCVSLLNPARFESWAVRTHAQRTQTGVALHAISLLVAGRATFERLPGRFTVVEQKGRLGVVKPGFQPSCRAHAALLVAVAAEARAVMTIRAIQLPSV